MGEPESRNSRDSAVASGAWYFSQNLKVVGHDAEPVTAVGAIPLGVVAKEDAAAEHDLAALDGCLKVERWLPVNDRASVGGRAVRAAW